MVTYRRHFERLQRSSSTQSILMECCRGGVVNPKIPFGKFP